MAKKKQTAFIILAMMLLAIGVLTWALLRVIDATFFKLL